MQRAESLNFHPRNLSHVDDVAGVVIPHSSRAQRGLEHPGSMQNLFENTPKTRSPQKDKLPFMMPVSCSGRGSSLIKLNQQMSTDNLVALRNQIKHPLIRIKSEMRASNGNRHVRNRQSEILLNRDNDCASDKEPLCSFAHSIPAIHFSNHKITAPHTSINTTTTTNTHSKTSQQTQRIYIIRHGERVDSTFGINWIDAVFDQDGNYRRLNLNLPKIIPVRKSIRDYLFDPPLTELGLLQSKMIGTKMDISRSATFELRKHIGEELLSSGNVIEFCYCSPALRCVQTASKILEGLKRTDINIRIEPCLFEFLKWHPIMPIPTPFMKAEELRVNGYNVDTFYRPVYPLESLRKDEDETMFYTRSHAVMLQITRNHKITDNILIVGHAPTLEVTTRQLLGLPPRIKDLKLLVRQIPYLSLQTIERRMEDAHWRIRRPPIPPLKHCALEPFDWRQIR